MRGKDRQCLLYTPETLYFEVFGFFLDDVVLSPDGKVIIRAKNLKQYNKIVKKIKNAGGEKLTFKFRKRSVF